MPAPLSPLAISVNSVLGEVAGLLGYLEEVAVAAYPDILDSESTTGRHAAVTDNGAPQTITTGITNLESARNVTATAGGVAGDIKAIQVVVHGTNYNDDVISETLPAFTANTPGTVSGTLAFKTVTSFVIPAHDGIGATTSLGYDTSFTDGAIAKLVTVAIRAAMSRLESTSRVPFFVTRYATKELATQESWVQGTDYHKIVQAIDYRNNNWIRQGARFHLPWCYLGGITEARLSLANNNQIFSVDTNWLQIDAEHGVAYIIPAGLATAGLSYSTLYGFGIAVRGSSSGMVPLLLHTRFTAGLVERTGTYEEPDADDLYDPDADVFNTIWDQELVRLYQSHLKAYAASKLMRPVGALIERGGLQISMDGLSESVNSQALMQRSADYEKAAVEWAEGFAQSSQGTPMVMC